MPKVSKQRKDRPKVSSAPPKDARQAASKQLQTAKKRSKAQARISKSQVADVTAQLNGEFAQVQSLYVKADARAQTQATPLPESSVQDLADVMKGL